MGIIKRQGIKNAIITYVGVLIGAFSVIFLQPSFLTSTELGFTRNLYNFSYLLGLALPLGLPNIVVRFYPVYKDNASIGKYFFGFTTIYFLITSLITLGVFFIFRSQISALYEKDSELFVAYFFCVIPYSLIIGFSTCVTSLSHAAYKSTVPSFLNDVFSRLCVILITVLYYYRFISFDVYVLLYVLIYAAVSVILIIYLRQFGLISFKINWRGMKQLDYKQMIPYGLMSSIVAFTAFGFRNVDALFLGMSSLSNVAVYSTAVFLALFIEVPLSSVERISHSQIANNFANGNTREVAKIYSESVKYLLVAGGFIFLGMNACAKFVFEFLPAEYLASVHLVLILSFAALVNISTGVNNAILFYSNHFRTGTLILIGAFVTALILDAWLIPAYGMTAAALITAGVSIGFNFSKYFFIYKLFGFQPYNRNSLKIAAVITVGFCLVLFLPSLTDSALANIFINGSIISVLYITAVYKMKIVPEIFETLLSRIKFAKK